MSIYQPYTYLIGWSKHSVFYYGVRYAKKCHPDDLWVTYFTSSKSVKTFRKEYGEPDIVEVRRTFDCYEKAILWEYKVLRRMKINDNDSFLNSNISGAISSKVSSKMMTEYWNRLSKEERYERNKRNFAKRSKDTIKKVASLAGKASVQKRTKEQKLEYGRRASKSRVENTTPEQRSEWAKKGLSSRWKSMSAEDRSNYVSERMKILPKESCIHCGRTLSKNQITRYHKDKCKYKVGMRDELSVSTNHTHQ
jgi:hypothetical protein